MGVSGFAFPYDRDTPAQPVQRRQIGGVAGAIAINFSHPVLNICFRRSCAALAIMAMPEEAMNKDHLLQARKDEVWFAGKTFVVQAKLST